MNPREVLVCRAEHAATSADTKHPLLHPLLASRQSPAAFDASAQVSPAEVDSLLEAARWAPSAGNSQPWAFIVGRRCAHDHERLARHLTASSAAWAQDAGLLIANLAHRFVEGTDWEYSEFSTYDLGQAVAHMNMQAQSLGLAVRQFRAFHRDRLAAEFGIPPQWEITTMSAIGRPQRPGSATTTTSGTVPRRDRKRLDQMRWPQALTADR